MKKSEFFYWGLLVLIFVTTNQVQAQQDESNSDFSVGADLYSSYVWRGTKLGQGPSVQPSVKFTSGGLTIGVWGAFDASGYAEADPYISYALPFGLEYGTD